MGDSKMTTLKTLNGNLTSVGAEAIETLAASLRGGVFRDGDVEYDEARTIWNARLIPFSPVGLHVDAAQNLASVA
jgi:hypothetical protein